MSIYRKFSGYCPVQNKEFSISIEYIDTSNLYEKSYSKGIATCDFASYGGDCDSSKCPIIKSAPKSL